MTTVNAVNEEGPMTPVGDDGIPTTVEFVADVFRACMEHSLALERSAGNLRAETRSLLARQRMAHKAIQAGEDSLDRKVFELYTLRGLLAEAIGLLERAVPGTDDQNGRTLWHNDFTDLVVRCRTTLPVSPKTEQAVPVDTGVGVDPTCDKPGHLASYCQHAPDGGNHPAAPSAG